jgi:hypothetical protein
MLESARQRQAETKRHTEELEKERYFRKHWGWYEWLQGNYLRIVQNNQLLALLEGVEDVNLRVRMVFEFKERGRTSWTDSSEDDDWL